MLFASMFGDAVFNAFLFLLILGWVLRLFFKWFDHDGGAQTTATVGDGFFGFMIFLAIGLWSTARVFKRFDNDGAVKGAARKGVVNLIGRWLK